MGLPDIHNIMFNAYIMFSVILGAWAVMMAVRNQSISGNFWGAIATITLLGAAILILGIIMALMGMRPEDERLWLYFLYMAWLVIIMPGLFTLLRGRDDRSAAIAFAMLAFFNVGVSLSMAQRVISTWS